jgi:hypothetical protein
MKTCPGKVFPSQLRLTFEASDERKYGALNLKASDFFGNNLSGSQTWNFISIIQNISPEGIKPFGFG